MDDGLILAIIAGILIHISFYVYRIYHELRDRHS